MLYGPLSPQVGDINAENTHMGNLKDLMAFCDTFFFNGWDVVTFWVTDQE